MKKQIIGKPWPPTSAQKHLENIQYAKPLAQEHGASSWLTALPIQEHGFALHKDAFRDIPALRYGWQPSHLPTNCVCGASLTIEHALSYTRGGFHTLRHNDIQNLTANMLAEVCHEVGTEPHLQPLNGEHLVKAIAISDNNARLDIAASGFWGGSTEKAMFDSMVFNPFAPTNRQSILSSTYTRHKKEKKRSYGQRVGDVEFATFSPLVMSLTGGLIREATCVYKRLASLLASKCEQTYSKTLEWIRCFLLIALLRSSIRCLRGARTSSGKAARGEAFAPVDVVLAETLVG